MNDSKVIFVMGVSGVGKSTIGSQLANALGVPFFDGDDYHPKANIEKMGKGQPLTDDDRFGWLQQLNHLASDQIKIQGCVIACSALKESYRQILQKDILGSVTWVFLSGTFETVKKRILARKNHFMGEALLQSQFDTLEEPAAGVVSVDIRQTPDEIIKFLKAYILEKTQFGVLGLGVMGKSLSRNLGQKGFKLSLFNRHVDALEVEVAQKMVDEHKELSSALPFDDLVSFVQSIQTPRKIMLMVNAGKTVDQVIEDLLPHLSANDILIDGGNSNYLKTKERFDYLKSKQIHFVGAGVSGGEEGALKGPCIMPSGDENAYAEVRPFLEAIAAKDKDDRACCAYIGNEGSGHFVKMVHNGIEYVEMQLLAEVYTLLKHLGNDLDEIAAILSSWKVNANSYLLDITIDILRKKEGSDWLVNKILDKAGNKGTGNWTTIATAQLGVPSTMIATALFARYASAFKEERVAASAHFESKEKPAPSISKEEVLEAYQFARAINHYQGFKLIAAASEQHNWKINLSELARIWTNGCIIKSDLMIELVEVLKENQNILDDTAVIDQLQQLKPSTKKVIAAAVLSELPIPCLSESIQFLTNFAVENSAANIIQAQRDYFGAHTYQRNDDESGKAHHTHWSK